MAGPHLRRLHLLQEAAREPLRPPAVHRPYAQWRLRHGHGRRCASHPRSARKAATNRSRLCCAPAWSAGARSPSRVTASSWNRALSAERPTRHSAVCGPHRRRHLVCRLTIVWFVEPFWLPTWVPVRSRAVHRSMGLVTQARRDLKPGSTLQCTPPASTPCLSGVDGWQATDVMCDR